MGNGPANEHNLCSTNIEYCTNGRCGRAKLSSCCLLYSKNDTFDVQWHGALQVLEAGRQLALDIISGSKIDKL